ncbi:MAG: D-aminoacyl-tRNA deacylase, partial [Bryobacteraceae bacterium]|nr:D-aminoacyl-tRNA deacylase [Bryobacteraceae bacterium]
MIMVLQRAGSSHVQVGADTVGSIESGLVVLLGVAKGDTRKDADYLVEKA